MVHLIACRFVRSTFPWLGLAISGALAPSVSAAAASPPTHWAFQRVERPAPPAVDSQGWCRNPIDQFVYAELLERGIRPSPPAPPAALRRRLNLDLVGLPPEPAEVAAFVSSPTDEAYAGVVETLLASPHFGEQWGRHWLDQARYADSMGHEFDYKREIWKYRDWVIDALNSDKPFDAFLIEQIAGDLLPNATVDQKVATGFSCNALQEYGDVYQTTIDRVNAYGTAMLGLTLGCARCHDHKFDPFSQRDYYQLYAFFNDSQDATLDLSSPAEAGTRQALVKQADYLKKELLAYQNGPDKDPLVWCAQLAPKEIQAASTELREAILRVSKDRTPEQIELITAAHATAQLSFIDALESRIETWAASLPKDPATGQLSDGEVAAYLGRARSERMMNRPPQVLAKFWEQDSGRKQRDEVIAELEKRTPPPLETKVMTQRIDHPQTNVFKLGDHRNLGEVVEPDVPAVFGSIAKRGVRRTRLDLASWTASRDNPLSARVAVNRVWQTYFGVGLVATSDNLGTQTARPAYAALLDWLAAELMDNGWSLKHIHRLIVTSATYRQASLTRADLHDVDPANELFARQSRLRLDAENIRDSALRVSGLLNDAIGGRSVFPYQPEGVMVGRADHTPWTMSEGADRYRRGLYTHYWRLTPHPFLNMFDVPDAVESCTRRQRSNTPIQALTLLNDPMFVEAAQAFASRICDQSPVQDDGGRIEWAVEQTLARPAAPEEIDVLAKLLARSKEAYATDPARAKAAVGATAKDDARAAELAAWTSVARALLNLDEFITRE